VKRSGLYLSILATCLAAADATAADDKAVAACQKQENEARTKCAAELVKAAKSMLAAKAVAEAREELRFALQVAPDDAAARAELAKLPAAAPATADAAAKKAAASQDAAHKACKAHLESALVAWNRAERAEEYARLATTLVGLFDESGDEAKKLELDWYEPYLAWARKKDVARWEKGDEFVNGAWTDADKVKALDAAHADWKSPWIVGDGVHEVRTNMPLRAAKRVVEYVRNWRRFVTTYFAGEWEWKQPKGALPIYLTATQDDYQERLKDYAPEMMRSKASALYVQKTGGLCPVFVTFQPKDGRGATIDWPALFRDVRHETAHQMLYESCMAQGAAVGGNIDWVSEGIANFFGAYEPQQGKWTLGLHEAEPYANGTEPGSFAWTKTNFEKVPPLSKYFFDFKPNLDTVQDYWVATTLTYFLLLGENRRYRTSMVKLLTEVHMAKGGPKSFASCFGAVDFAKMQDEWKSFVDGLVIEKK
jgi:hypothetical protein